MGLEWINKTSKTFVRSVARGRSHILTPRLLDPSVNQIRRSFEANLSTGHEMVPGKRIYLRIQNGCITLLNTDERVIGESAQPPQWLLQHIGACPEGTTIGVINGVNEFGGTADVSLPE
jgi:hypothetical protein